MTMIDEEFRKKIESLQALKSTDSTINSAVLSPSDFPNPLGDASFMSVNSSIVQSRLNRNERSKLEVFFLFCDIGDKGTSINYLGLKLDFFDLPSPLLSQFISYPH